MPVSENAKERLKLMNSQLLQAGGTGFFKGIFVALVSGYLLSYRYNHGHNARFFLVQHKAWWLVSWGVVGITFSAETARMQIAKQIAEEENIKRELYFSQGLGDD